MAHEVFISHSSKDKPIADGVCAHLESAGLRCWIAPRDISPGEDWPAAIANAISQSRIMVLIFSANANASEQISRELSMAADYKLVIIPFKIEDVKPEPGKQYFLSRTHWLDAVNPPTREQITILVQRVKSILPATASQAGPLQSLPMPLPAKPPAKVRRRGSWLVWAAAALFVLLLLAAGSVFAIRKLWQLAAPAVLPDSALVTLTPAPTQTPPPAVVNTPAPATLPPLPLQDAFGSLHLSEPFNDNSNAWSEGNVDGDWWVGTRLIQDGVLDWDGVSRRDMYSNVYPETPALREYISDQQVSTRVNLLNPDMAGAFGLTLRAVEDESRFYAFFADANGTFGFFLISDSDWTPLIDWQENPYLDRAGWNTMAVQASGGHFRLYFNNHLLGELEDATLASGQSGIIVSVHQGGEKLRVQFDDFEVRVPAQSAQASPAPGAAPAGVQLEVTHNPSPATIQVGGASGGAYTCAFETSVKAVGAGMHIQEFGMYFWENGQWVHSASNNGQPWSREDFADWYSCPSAYIASGQACSDPNNWIGVSSSDPLKAKTYYVGVTDAGEEVRGEAVIECQP